MKTKIGEGYFNEWLIDQKLEHEQEQKVCDILNMTMLDAADWLDELKTRITESADRSSFDEMMKTLPYLAALDYAIERLTAVKRLVDIKGDNTLFSDLDTDPGLPNDGYLIIMPVIEKYLK